MILYCRQLAGALLSRTVNPECYRNLLVKHRETLNVESALFNRFFRLEKLSIFETLGNEPFMLNIRDLL